MTKIDNIAKTNGTCTGCRTCEQLCPIQCIQMQEDIEGFLVAHVDKSQCIHCGACSRHCPQIISSVFRDKMEPKVFAAVLRKPDELKQSSSGGAFSALAEYVLDRNGVVFGCAFDDNLIAHHRAVFDKSELSSIRGSKYVQSNTRNTFSEVKSYLEQGRYVLYTGTPCQIAGLKLYLDREYTTLITVDLVCHGIPSPWLFAQNISWIEKRRCIHIKSYEFRSKRQNGWGQNFYFYYNYFDIRHRVFGEHGGPYYKDPYYDAFLLGSSYRECCYECKYATEVREGDFTIADYWGVEEVHLEIPTENGVSLIILNTLKAEVVLRDVNMLSLTPSTLDQAKKKQNNLKSPTMRPTERDVIYKRVKEAGYAKFASQHMHSRAYYVNQLRENLPMGLKQVKNFILGKLLPM